MKHTDRLTTIVMWWDGTYTLHEIRYLNPLNKINGNGLYLVVGSGPREFNDSIKYCGITERTFRARLDCHHKIQDIQRYCRARDLKIWLGNIEYPKRFNRRHLEQAEKLIVYFLAPKFNERKKVSLPYQTCMISRWYKKSDSSPRHNRLSFLQDVPDVIWYDGEDLRTGNLRIKNSW